MGRGEGKGEGFFSKAKETASKAAGAASAMISSERACIDDGGTPICP